MTFKVQASDSFAWMADRLPEHQYREMIAQMQEAVTTIAQEYGMNNEVCEAFGIWSALKFDRE